MAHKHETHKHKIVFWGILATEISHIFCCVLPMLFSLAGLLTTLGLVVVMPDWLDHLHHVMHEWEIPAIALAGIMVALGWGLHFYSYKEDCHDHGCHHKPCTPRKKAAAKILIFASFLFVVNMLIFLFFHDGISRLSNLLG